MEYLNTLSIEQKAKMICLYYAMRGTDNQIKKVLKSFKNHEELDRFLLPRLQAFNTNN